MKISVIIPAYNEAESLPATLTALMAQDYPEFEAIVVDNASSDKTFEAALAFPGVTVVREERKGTMWACERGRNEASGTIIVRMDADCLPDKSWLSRGVRHFADPRVAVVSGPYDYHDAEGIFRPISLFIQKNFFYVIHQLFQMLKLGGITMGGNTFMRASALKAARGFDTSITFYGDDTDIPKRLSRFGRCIYDRSLVLKTSARRFKREGVLRLQARYTYHFFRVIFQKKPESPADQS